MMANTILVGVYAGMTFALGFWTGWRERGREDPCGLDAPKPKGQVGG